VKTIRSVLDGFGEVRVDQRLAAARERHRFDPHGDQVIDDLRHFFARNAVTLDHVGAEAQAVLVIGAKPAAMPDG